MTIKLLVISILVALSIQHATAQTVYDLHLNNLLSMQQGIGWPHSLNVAEGHEALMKLRRQLPNPQTCMVTTPMGVTFNVLSPPDSRFVQWGNNCGLRVRNTVVADEGRWRLTTTSGATTLTGWIEIYIEDDTTSYTAPTISLRDGEATSVELSTIDNLYCMVAQPFSESSLVPGHCEVTLDRATRAVQGNWDVLLGIPGKVAELHVQRQVAVEAERLDVGYVHDSNANKLHLHCNILHTAKNITFCRFQKTNVAYGFNIMDGLSDGQHSYYGEGFDHRQCGITIEQPTAQDYGTWRCSVGVKMWVGTNVVPQAPLQALISVAPNTGNGLCTWSCFVGVKMWFGTNVVPQASLQALISVAPNTGNAQLAYRSEAESQDTEMETVFTQVAMQFTVMCRADRSLRYCWFQHPNGTQYTPLPLSDDHQQFWYAGGNFQSGDCGITFSYATEGDAGEWTCHMGPSDQVGLEITGKLNVRVTGPLAAHYKEIESSVGESVTLYCHTANGVRPLDYCRFMTPSYVGLSIDASVTEENAIMNRFYFTPGRQLDHGDCSLTISSVQHEDLGVWTCAALVNEDSVEARDTIELYVTGAAASSRALSQAGIAGMVIGLVGLLAVLGGVVWYKRSLFPPKRSNRSTDPTIAFSRRTASTSGSTTSSERSISEVEIDIRPTNSQE